MMGAAAKLTSRQKAFVFEYLVDMSATGAAKRAGYSVRTAYSAGQRLLKNVEITAAIRASLAEREERTQITSDRVIRELGRVAFFDPRRLFDADGAPRPITELDDDTAAVVAKIDVSLTRNDDGSVTRVAKIKLADKLAALEKLGRHLGLFDKGQTCTAENPIAVLIRHAQETALPVVRHAPPDGDDDKSSAAA